MGLQPKANESAWPYLDWKLGIIWNWRCGNCKADRSSFDEMDSCHSAVDSLYAVRCNCYADDLGFNLVKKEIDGVEADNSEEVSTKVRQLLREDPVLLRRIGEAYPNLEINSKKFAEKLKAQAEAVQESVEEKKQAVADAVAEGKLAAEAAAEERRLAAEERKQLVQEAVEEKKIAFEEKKQAVALAVSKAQQKRQSEEAFRARMKKADQKKREEKIRKGNKK